VILHFEAIIEILKFRNFEISNSAFVGSPTRYSISVIVNAFLLKFHISRFPLKILYFSREDIGTLAVEISIYTNKQKKKTI
jgi:hypothetical protein